ncbi:MAG: hypothetical protein RIB46_17670 [Pseudomonadales bacterium]
MLLLLALWGPAAAAAAADGDCQVLHELDAEAAQTFQFEGELGHWEALIPRQDYRLRRIDVVRQNVFEREDMWLHRAANRYHVMTRERAILAALPVRPGERVDVRRLREAERILRAKAYLYDARVVPARVCDGDQLDVYVVTRDVWTLEPRISLDRAGGENEIGLGITDVNLLGLGKALTVSYEKDADRRGALLWYGDPNIGGSRWAMDLTLIDNDDGERAALSLRRPFYELDARYGMFFDVDHFDRDEGLYNLSRKFWEYQAESRVHRVAGGWSPGLEGRFVHRWLLGMGYEDHRFELPAAFTAAFPDAPPADRRFGYPFLAYQRIEDDFDTRMNLDRVQRTEDIALGQRIYAEFGYSSSATGGRGRHLIGRFRFADAAWLTPRQLLAFGAAVSGYYDLDDDRAENLEADAQVAYRYRHAGSWSLLVRGSITAARGQTFDRQLRVGGEEGLRGFPTRYQNGNRRFLVTIEERYYSNVYPLRMFRLGGAVFLDVGRAWYDGEVPAWLPDDRDAGYYGVLSNVGVGLRLESTRTRGDRILHLDLGFPLRNGPDVRSVEVTLTAKQTL